MYYERPGPSIYAIEIWKTFNRFNQILIKAELFSLFRESKSLFEGLGNNLALDLMTFLKVSR